MTTSKVLQSSTSRRTLLAVGGAVAGLAAAGGNPSGSSRVYAAAGYTRDLPVDGYLAVVGATVIDATGAPPIRDANVLVRRGRIVAVGSGRRVPVPSGATVVDGRGRFLIPGLADMHSHSTQLERIYPPLYLANGVTTVREMAANPEISAFRDRVEAGTLLGPRWTIGSKILDGSPSLWDTLGADIYRAIGTPAEARTAVREEQAAGAAFIKTYTRLTRDSFHALAGEARRRGIPFAGHCPDFVPVGEASDAGLRTLEHSWQMWYDMSSQEDRLRAAIARVPIGPGEYSGWFTKMHPIEYAAARSIDRRKAERLFARLAHNGTAVTPTLSVHRVADLPQDVDLHDPRYRYFPAETIAVWEWSMNEIYLKNRPPEQDGEKRELFYRRMRLTRALHDAGVPLLAGTDTGTSYLMPGFSLHDELALMVSAGLPAMAVLQAATRTPARVLGSNGGTIEPGRDADLVLLDADPLRDIGNTTRIHSLVYRGRYIGPDERQAILDDVLAAAQETPAARVAARTCPC